jgi:hypothetical protein
LILEIKVLDYFETSKSLYPATLRHILQNLDFQQRGSDTLALRHVIDLYLEFSSKRLLPCLVRRSAPHKTRRNFWTHF